MTTPFFVFSLPQGAYKNRLIPIGDEQAKITGIQAYSLCGFILSIPPAPKGHMLHAESKNKNEYKYR